MDPHDHSGKRHCCLSHAHTSAGRRVASANGFRTCSQTARMGADSMSRGLECALCPGDPRRRAIPLELVCALCAAPRSSGSLASSGGSHRPCPTRQLARFSDPRHTRPRRRSPLVRRRVAPHLAVFNKMLLLDAGIYGFIALRQLGGTGFDLRLRLRDAGIGLREVTLYTPLALALGLGLGFLHLHAGWPGLAPIAGAWVFTFFLIAIPEELFFRGWMQNLLERRIGRTPTLLVTAILFGLSHFNKRAVLFNWRYVLLAAIAGIFYGRAWRQDRRVGASAITHATVDTIWSLWLR